MAYADILEAYFATFEPRYTLEGRAEDIAQGVQEVIANLPEEQRLKIQAKIDKVGAAIITARAKEKALEVHETIADFFNRNPIVIYSLIGLLIFRAMRK